MLSGWRGAGLVEEKEIITLTTIVSKYCLPELSGGFDENEESDLTIYDHHCYINRLQAGGGELKYEELSSGCLCLAPEVFLL
jgi:hypothetical protein